MSEEIVVSGPEIDFEVPEAAFGELLLEGLRSQPRDKIIQINGETGEQQTVGELLELGLQVAEGLKSLGVQQGDVITLVANYGSKVFGAVLGGIAIAAPIFPISPSFKTWELKNLFFAGEPKIVFCEKQCSQYVIEALDLLENKADIIVLGDESPSPRIKKFSDILKKVDVDSFQPAKVKNPKEDIAIIVCSSGTTGFPKAVAISHRHMGFQVTSYKQIPDFYKQERYLQVTHLFWVTGMSAFFFSCQLGVPRVYVPHVTGENLLRAVHNHKPGWVFMAPIFLSWMLNHPDFEKYDVSSLKNISVGGSSLPQTTVDLMKKKWPAPVQFAQTFGCSELSIDITVPSDKYIKSCGLIGAKGIQIKVVDVETGKSLGPNQIGELRFKNKICMMKKYLKNEEASEQAIDETGFYKSGDLGYYNEDHHLFIVNRIKDLIKCKNHQISPLELEDVILSIPEVEDVAVVGVPHEVDQYRPLALVVKKKNAELTEQAIINYVADKMSKEKQLYGGVKFVDSIPRTASGKIKRPELKKLV